MPRYSFINNDTGEEFELDMKMAELDVYKAEHPEMTQTIKRAAPVVIQPMGMKPEQGFRDVLRTIKKGNRGSTVNTF